MRTRIAPVGGQLERRRPTPSLTSPEPVNPAPCQASARPMPRRRAGARSAAALRHRAGRARAAARAAVRARSRSNSAASAARSRTSCAADALAQDLAGRRHVARAGRRCAGGSRAGEMPSASAIAVDLHLGRELDLRRPEAAERAVGRRVRRASRGRGCATFGQRYGPPAWSAPRDSTTGRQRAVGAAVHDDLDVLGHEPAVARHAGPVADDRRVALGRRGDVLVAVVDHAHRPAAPCARAARRGWR